MKSALHLRVQFSDDDDCYVATCTEYPYLSGLAEDKLDAIEELKIAICAAEDINNLDAQTE